MSTRRLLARSPRSTSSSRANRGSSTPTRWERAGCSRSGSPTLQNSRRSWTRPPTRRSWADQTNALIRSGEVHAMTRNSDLTTLIAEPGFPARHIATRADDLAPMLQAIGASSIDALIAETIPDSIRQEQPLAIGPALSEPEALQKMRAVAARNKPLISMIGQGYYGAFLPSVIQRNVLESPAWYTAYTPYQSEISQGRLEALLNFQTMIADLTGLETANASLLDEATAAAEGMAMARRIAASKALAFFVDRDCHPQSIAVVHTRAQPLGWEILVGDPATDLKPGRVFGALFQYPGCSGEIRDYRQAIGELHAA